MCNLCKALFGYRSFLVDRPGGAALAVNLMSKHDRLCLADVVLYCHRTVSDRYNEEVSFHCSHGGPRATRDAAKTATEVEKNRCKQMRNFLTALAVSRTEFISLQDHWDADDPAS